MNLQAIAANAFRAVPLGIRAPITFTKTKAGTVDAATNRGGAPVTRTWPGYAVEEDAQPKRYASVLESLNMKATEIRSVFFIPTTAADLPELDATCTWGLREWTVRSVDAVSPDGNAIGASVVITR